MATSLSDFYEPLRFLLGDDDPDIKLREDAQLLSAMRTVLNLGRVTGNGASADGYALDQARTSVTPTLDPAEDPKAYAQLLFHSAKFFVTDLAPTAWRTRAFSETIGEHRDKVFAMLEECYNADNVEMGESGDYE